jgi:hypothetical protein
MHRSIIRAEGSASRAATHHHRICMPSQLRAGIIYGHPGATVTAAEPCGAEAAHARPNDGHLHRRLCSGTYHSHSFRHSVSYDVWYAPLSCGDSSAAVLACSAPPRHGALHVTCGKLRRDQLVVWRVRPRSGQIMEPQELNNAMLAQETAPPLPCSALALSAAVVLGEYVQQSASSRLLHSWKRRAAVL